MILIAGVIAGALQTITGFGGSIILMAVLPYFFNMLQAAAIGQSVLLGLNLALLWSHWKKIQWKEVVFPILIYVPCSLISIQLASGLDLSALKIAFGAFLVLLGLYFFFFSQKVKLKKSIPMLVICSAVSGICAGFFGIGGPLMALFFVTITDDHDVYTADLQSIFASNGITALTMRVVKGIYTADLIPITLCGIAGILIGKKLGMRFVDRINGDMMKKLVYGFVCVSGLVTVVQQLV